MHHNVLADIIFGSTLQSLRRGQATEITYLNGEIVRLGEHLALPTPLNAAVVALVQEIEQHREFFTPQTLRERIGAITGRLGTR